MYKRPLSKRQKKGFQDQLLLNAGQKNCRMLQEEHSAILLTFIKLPFVIKIFVLSIFEWPFYTGFTEKHYNFYYTCKPLWNQIADKTSSPSTDTLPTHTHLFNR